MKKVKLNIKKKINNIHNVIKQINYFKKYSKILINEFKLKNS
jgi:hypothetical protein